MSLTDPDGPITGKFSSQSPYLMIISVLLTSHHLHLLVPVLVLAVDYVRGEAPKVLCSGSHPFASASSLLAAYAPDATVVAVAGDSELVLFDALSALPPAAPVSAGAARSGDEESKPEPEEYTMCPSTLLSHTSTFGPRPRPRAPRDTFFPIVLTTHAYTSIHYVYSPAQATSP